jgi:outer membrane lipoprotein-sorting protein
MQKIILFIFLLFIPLYELYEVENMSAYEIMKHVEKNTRSNSSYQKDRFIIVRDNNEKNKEFLYFRKKDGAINKTLLKITNPAKDKSISLLTVNSGGKNTDQWLFLPELNKVKPILNKNKGQAFLNSDFYYEDFEEKDIETNLYEIIKKEDYNHKSCYVIEAIAKDKSSTVYSKKKLWVDLNDFIILKTEFYENDKLTKTLNSDIIQKESNIYTVMQSTMIPEDKPGNRSALIVTSIQHNIKIDDYVFTVQNLSRR